MSLKVDPRGNLLYRVYPAFRRGAEGKQALRTRFSADSSANNVYYRAEDGLSNDVSRFSIKGDLREL
jgi:hypothetical protein